MEQFVAARAKAKAGMCMQVRGQKVLLEKGPGAESKSLL